MRIGIYARGLSEKSGGVKVYINELTKAIINNIGKKDELFIFHSLKEGAFSEKKNVKEIMLKSKNKLYSDFIEAPKEINKHNLDVVFFPKNVIPYGIKAKKILTIHDLAYYMPKYDAYKFSDTVYMKKMIKSSCKRADKIIAVSENTKNDLINILNVPQDKISVVHEGADKKFKKIKDKKILSEVRKKYKLDNPFIFYAGSISPRKNIKRLVKVFNDIHDNVKMDLVITGNKLWNNDEEMKAIKKNSRIKVFGFVPEDHLPVLYNLASAYVYPSLYEGFGLPILEAQACGCPILASNASSLPEVAGKGALYFDPYNEEDLSYAIIKITKDQNLRRSLIKEGLKNSKNFSWDKTARRTLDLMRAINNDK